jgi:hypothetical protein
MRICTAPTIFDGLDREKIIAWLEQEPTIALTAALGSRIREITERICEISLGPVDSDVGLTYRALRAQLDAHKQLREWLMQSETRSSEVKNGKA